MDVRFLPRMLFELSYRRYCGSAPLVVINDYGCTEQYGRERKARHNTLSEADMLALPLPSRSHKTLSATVYGLARHYPPFCLALYISMGIELWAGTVTIFDLNSAR